MAKSRTIRWGLVLLSISMCAGAQETSQGTPPTTPPAPAFGQSVPILSPENPPVSGLDLPSLELKTVSRSFISPALQVGESYDSNSQNSLAGSQAEGVSHVLGALDLQKFWPRSDLFLEYLGGAAFGNSPYYVRNMQAAGLEGITRWRTGQISVRDAFSYLPDGNFSAGSAGGLPGFGIATGGLGLGMPGLFHQAFGSVGTIPRLSNTAVLDVVQAINPRSAVTLVGAYTNAHYYHNTAGLVDGDESTVEVGYSRLISRRDQLGLVYAAQLLRFPDSAGGEAYNNVINARWSHIITGRMSFIGGLGPQFTEVKYGISNTSVSLAARAILHYRFEHTSLTAAYEKFTSPGSGFFAGADTQRAQFTVGRPIGRTYDFAFESAFSYNKRLQPIGNAVGASSYKDGSVGAVLRKHLGRTYDAIAAYHWAVVDFNIPVTLSGSTGSVNRRQVVTVALEWHPRAIRIE